MLHDDYCPLPVVFCIIIHFHTRINQLTSIKYIISCMLMTSTHIMLFNRLNMMFHQRQAHRRKIQKQNFNEVITHMVKLAEKVPGAVLLTWMSERRENKRRVERQKTHRVCCLCS